MFRNCSNRNVALHARRGEEARSSTGNMSVTSPRGMSYGWLSNQLRRILSALSDRDSIDLVIYSFATPIAWRDRGVWVIPDARYSIITSSKHHSELWVLPDRLSIPEDCGVEEYERYVQGLMIYTGKGTKPGPRAA